LRRSVEIQNFAIRHPRGSAGLDAELLPEQGRTLLIQVQCGRPVAAACVTPHERAPGLLVERIEPAQPLTVLDGLAECALVFEGRNEAGQNVFGALPKPLACALDPLARTIRKKVALVQPCRTFERIAFSGKRSIDDNVELDQIDVDTRGLTKG
jgi:hypothetical protein